MIQGAISGSLCGWMDEVVRVSDGIYLPNVRSKKFIFK